MNPARRTLLLALALVGLGGCSGALVPSQPPTAAPTPVPRTSSPAPTVDWGPVAAFHSPLQMDARTIGSLRITDRCTFLERDGERTLLAWPAERTRWNPGDGSITFRTRAGDEVTARDGDELVLGGGGSSAVEGGGTGPDWAARMAWIAAPDPSCIIDLRWLVSELALE